MKQIQLTKGKVAIVDDEDYERLSRHKWYALKSRNTWYAQRSIHTPKRGAILMHREIAEAAGLPLVDHRDFDGLHNWRSNLRPCTRSQSEWNKGKCRANKTGFKGVYRETRSGMFLANIRVFGKDIYLGRSKDPAVAARMYDAGARKYHGEFAYQNFTQEAAAA